MSLPGLSSNKNADEDKGNDKGNDKGDKTRWSSKIKESFVLVNHSNSDSDSDEEGDINEGFSASIPETDIALNIPISADENILLKGISAAKDEIPVAHSYSEKTLSDQYNSLKQNPNLMKAASLYKNGIQYAKTMVGQKQNAMMGSVVGFYYKDPNAPVAKRSSSILARQVSLYLAIPMTYWIVLNWWHTWNYTDGMVDFKSVLEWKSVKIIQFALEPPIMMLDIINYYLLAQRLDKNLEPRWREWFRKLWDWRPVTFTLFYFITFAGMAFSPFFKMLTDVLEGKPGILSAIVSAGSILLYFSYNFTFERFVKYLKIVGLQLFVPIIMLFVFVLVLILSFISSVILSFYLGFYSHLALFYHNGFNPFTIFKKIRQIFEDLQDAPVTIMEPEKTDNWTKFKNFGFRNFHNLFMLFMVLVPLLLKNCTEALANVESVELLSVIIIINLLLFGLFGLAPIWGTVRYFLNLAIQFAFSEKKIIEERDLQPIPTGEGGGGTIPSAPPLPTNSANPDNSTLPSIPSAPPLPTADSQ
jgi:hypothetical protein